MCSFHGLAIYYTNWLADPSPPLPLVFILFKFKDILCFKRKVKKEESCHWEEVQQLEALFRRKTRKNTGGKKYEEESQLNTDGNGDESRQCWELCMCYFYTILVRVYKLHQTWISLRFLTLVTLTLCHHVSNHRWNKHCQVWYFLGQTFNE